MKLKLFIFFTGVLYSSLLFADIHWLHDLDEAKREAIRKNKLIMIIDMHESQVIEKDNFFSHEISNKLVPLLSKEGHEISIRDINGNVLVNCNNIEKLIEVLFTIPENVDKLNAELREYNEYGKSAQRSFDLALAYQDLALNIPTELRSEILSISNSHFNDAAKLGKKEKRDVLMEASTLRVCYNEMSKGEYEKTINMLNQKVDLDDLNIKNMALAYYILSNSYEMTGDLSKAEHYADKIQLTPGGYEFMKKLKGHWYPSSPN